MHKLRYQTSYGEGYTVFRSGTSNISEYVMSGEAKPVMHLFRVSTTEDADDLTLAQLRARETGEVSWDELKQQLGL